MVAPILPEAGDWAIGVDAAPFLTYFGQFLGDGNQAPHFNFMNNDNVITGKYYVTDKMAYRAMVRIGLTSSTNSDTAKKTKISATNITIGAGIEKRKGKGRLQGFYGAEAMIMLGGGDTKVHLH